MVGVGHADLGIGPEAALAAHHHGGDAGQVGLEGHHLQVEHQLRRSRRTAPGCRPASRWSAATSRSSFSARSICRSISRIAVEVLVDLAPVGGAEVADELARALGHQVEDAPALVAAAGPGPRVERPVVGAEEALEDRAAGWSRAAWASVAAPGEAVGVRAAIAGVAVAHRARVFAARARATGTASRAPDAGPRSGPPRCRSGCRRPRSSCGWTPVRKQAPARAWSPGPSPSALRVVVGQAGQHEECPRGRAERLRGSARSRSRGPSPSASSRP